MSIVNFKIPRILDERVDKTIKDKGFSSKAEFFRVAAMQYLESLQSNGYGYDWNSVLTYQLKGSAAKRADKMAEEALCEHREGKTRRIESLADLM